MNEINVYAITQTKTVPVEFDWIFVQTYDLNASFEV